MITIYTDGAFNPQQSVGGWAAIIVDENGNEKEYSGGVKNTTSQRMEVLAVLEGLFTLSKPTKVEIVTDSKYVSNSMNKKWLHKWVEESQFDRIHFDLWRILYNLDKMHDITIKWVKGHSGHYYNERADKLAKSEVKKIVGDKAPRGKKGSYYAVAKGRKVGIFSTWDECNKQVNKYKGAIFKKFDTEDDANMFISENS